MITRSLDEWRDIKGQALDIRHSEVVEAMKDEIRARMAAALTDALNPIATEAAIRYAQGQYHAHKRDIMVIEDLIRMATSVGKKAQKKQEYDL